jgi:hypothetical protein
VPSTRHHQTYLPVTHAAIGAGVAREWTIDAVATVLAAVPAVATALRPVVQDGSAACTSLQEEWVALPVPLVDALASCVAVDAEVLRPRLVVAVALA